MYLVQIRKIIRKTKRSGYFVAHGKTTRCEGLTIVNTANDGEKILVDRHTVKASGNARRKKQKMLDELIKYCNGMNARDEVVAWVNLAVGARIKKHKPVNQGEMEHIIDFLVSPKAPQRLLKMSIQQAKEATEKWSRSNQKKGKNIVDTNHDVKSIHDYVDGSRIVKLLTKSAYQREGTLMSHCLGGYSVNSETEIYSYRDKENQPHATFEVRRMGGEVAQIKGKGNGPIHPKYIVPILDFLIAVGQKPRPSEMKNLGYYHIDPAHHEFVKSIVGADKKLVTLHGELYAHS